MKSIVVEILATLILLSLLQTQSFQFQLRHQNQPQRRIGSFSSFPSLALSEKGMFLSILLMKEQTVMPWQVVVVWANSWTLFSLFLPVRTIAKNKRMREVTESEANHETTPPSHSKEPEIKSIQIPDNGGISEHQQHAILRIYGPDQKGIVAAFAQLLHGHGCNILDSEQHASGNIFFQRICFDYSTMFTDRQTIEMGISDVCKRFGMQSGTYSFNGTAFHPCTAWGAPPSVSSLCLCASVNNLVILPLFLPLQLDLTVRCDTLSFF